MKIDLTSLEKSIRRNLSKKRYRDSAKGKEKIKEYRKSYFCKSVKGRGYRMSKDDYSHLLTTQKECCCICGKHQSSFHKRLSIDHCHATGKVRGLLCNNCNLILGFAEDNPIILQKSIEYLHRTKISSLKTPSGHSFLGLVLVTRS